MTIERAVLAFAGLMVLASLALGYFVSPWWYLLTAFVGLNLFQSAFTGFCPPAIVLRKAGHEARPGLQLGRAATRRRGSHAMRLMRSGAAGARRPLPRRRRGGGGGVRGDAGRGRGDQGRVRQGREPGRGAGPRPDRRHDPRDPGRRGQRGRRGRRRRRHRRRQARAPAAGRGRDRAQALTSQLDERPDRARPRRAAAAAAATPPRAESTRPAPRSR